MLILLKFVLENVRGNWYYFIIDKGLCILIWLFMVVVKFVKWWYLWLVSKLVDFLYIIL